MDSTFIVAIAFFVFVAVALALRRSGTAPVALPYDLKTALFSPAERSFLGVLQQAVDSDYRVFGKVRIADVIEPRRGLARAEWQKAFNRINSKHFDFLLCAKDNLSIVCAIELDDKSHRKFARRQRDKFVGNVCRVAGLPILRMQARRTYVVQELRAKLRAAVEQRPESLLVRKEPAM